MAASKNSFGAQAELEVGGRKVTYFDLGKLAGAGLPDPTRLPVSIRVLLEGLLRRENGETVTAAHIETLAKYDPANPQPDEIPYNPARVLLQDFTGVPAVVDLAAMRSAMARLGGKPDRINPLVPVDLVIDHSVQVDIFAQASALRRNTEIEFDRNRERYEFLRWGQSAFENFRVVPPGCGICHQVNLEYLAQVVQVQGGVAFPDTLVGTDSHTTMINGMGVLGWGVGGIEAEAAMLGQPIYMLAPAVVGMKLTGKLPEGANATDLVLTVTQILRRHGVVGKFVEFYGTGLSSMSLQDRATIANMAPEYGATMGFFPVDDRTLAYMRQTGRDDAHIDFTEAYCKAQGLFRTDDTPDPQFAATLELDLSTIEPSLAGPKRPQDRIALSNMQPAWHETLAAPIDQRGFALPAERRDARVSFSYPGTEGPQLAHGSVVIAAITSCTNTSNPSVLIGAGVLARKAVKAGLTVEPYVKTSLAPGSRVVTEYLDKAGLTPYFEKLGFYTVGYGCTTCIGNSGPLPEAVAQAIDEGELVVASVLSGNRNFEGRVHQQTRANYLASPPLVVAYAIAGTVDIDLQNDPLGTGKDGQPVFLKDIWPTSAEIADHLAVAQDPATFTAKYTGIEASNAQWNAIEVETSQLYGWKDDSTYIQEPPFFVEMSPEVAPIAAIEEARAMILVGDSITTDHISPAGAIAPDSPAATYLGERGVARADFNTYGSRRGNDRIMTRGTFANIRLKNKLAPGTEGGWTTHWPTGEVVSIYEASRRYADAGTPTVVLAGRDYGMGSSRDWAAKGTLLLGIKAVIAESFERIHRSNLVGMGVLPLEFQAGETPASLGLTGQETFTIHIDDALEARSLVEVDIVGADGTKKTIAARCRLDSPVEVNYYRNGGILHTVLRSFAAA